MQRENLSAILIQTFHSRSSTEISTGTITTKVFLIYINDIAKQLLSLTKLFADDSSLFYTAAGLADIAGIISHDLIMLSNVAKQWLVKFNPTHN